jgi:peptidyl-prolyl cis-trans isomerase A (cyclophilin A)
MKPTATLLALASLPLLAAACSKSEPPPARTDTAVAAVQPAPVAAPATAAPAPAPDSFRVAFETSRGTFVVAVTRAWSPKGADRFHDLVQSGFLDDNRFFRVVPHFVAQFGLNDKPAINDQWDAKRLVDDSVKHSNTRGTLVFATQGPNTRAHQLFINLADNARLDGMGFSPFGRVVKGMDVVDSLYSGYGESPDQQMIGTLGNSYLTRTFPKLDYVKTAKIVTSP